MPSLGLSFVIFAAAGAIAVFGTRSVGGLPPEELGILLVLVGIGVVLAGWIVEEFRFRWSGGLQALVLWAAVYAGVVAAYAQPATAGLSRRPTGFCHQAWLGSKGNRRAIPFRASM